MGIRLPGNTMLYFSLFHQICDVQEPLKMGRSTCQRAETMATKQLWYAQLPAPSLCLPPLPPHPALHAQSTQSWLGPPHPSAVSLLLPRSSALSGAPSGHQPLLLLICLHFSFLCTTVTKRPDRNSSRRERFIWLTDSEGVSHHRGRQG